VFISGKDVVLMSFGGFLMVSGAYVRTFARTHRITDGAPIVQGVVVVLDQEGGILVVYLYLAGPYHTVNCCGHQIRLMRC
jgi:hypothetical protein